MASSRMLRHVALVTNRRFGGTYRLHHQGELGTTLEVSSNRRSVRRLLVTANVVPSSPILVTQMIDTIISSETSVLARATRRKITEDTILPFK
jgi:hypothetical protein